MKGIFEGGEGGTGPGVFAEVKGVLMALCFILILEAVVAELANVLFLHFVHADLGSTVALPG